MLGPAAESGAAAVASGVHWRIVIDSIECEPAQSQLTIGARIHYLGPKGPVEAPVNQLLDGDGRRHAPRSLVWRSGRKELAQWLSAGGLTNLQAEDVGTFHIKFDLREAAGALRLEFGDIRAFSLKRSSASACGGFLTPDRLQAPRASPRMESGANLRVHRGFYPCLDPAGARQRIEAAYPPYLPRRLVLLGRGYLPNAREIDLPMGRAAAQSYAYFGADNLDAIEAAARRLIPADEKQFAFNWGTQKTQSGNEAYAIGLYALRPCPR